MSWFSVTSRNVSLRADKCSHPFHPIFLLKLFLCYIAADWSTPFLFSHFSHLFKGADRRCHPAPEYIPCFFDLFEQAIYFKRKMGYCEDKGRKSYTGFDILHFFIMPSHLEASRKRNINGFETVQSDVPRKKTTWVSWVQTMSSRCRFSTCRSLTPYLLHNHGQQDSH